MNKKFVEEAILFASILKWVVISTAVGAIVGTAVAFFLKLLSISISFTSKNQYYFFLLPLAFFLSSAVVKYLAPDARGHGTEKVIEAIHKKSGKIKLMVVPVKLLATIITLATGGSAGKEGPSAQIGAGLSSFFADLLKFDKHDRKKIVICGISAGFSSVFGTPIAGAIFGVEVLFIGGILYEVLLPSFIAGITSYHVSSLLGVEYFHWPSNIVPAFSEIFFLQVIMAGIFFGLTSFLLIESLKFFNILASKINIYRPLKGVIGGISLVALSFLFSEAYLGLGVETIEGAQLGIEIAWYAFLVKILFTSITLNFEGSGGIVTPIFFIGTAAGSTFAGLTGLDTAVFASIGMVSLLAGAANTPIAASIMAVELFGPQIAPYAAVACVISFLITGHRSVYPSQVLAVRKSRSIGFKKGQEIENVDVRFRPSSRSMSRLMKIKKK